MPLTSVRVLDLTRLLPGPYCTMILSDFGAEVIKIEDPQIGDYAREYLPKIDENSSFFHSLNRNKKSVCLDLKSEEGKNDFLQLVKHADVLVESFRPDVMKRLGLDYELLKEVNPRLIYCAITGYGQTGPYAKYPGHDVNFISYAGLLNLMGERNRKPVIPAAQIADIGGGALPAAVGILLALFEREKSGKGQFVDISMLDGVISWLQILLPSFMSHNEIPKRGEQLLSGARACYEVYETKDHRWISVGALEEKFWRSFCQAIHKSELIEYLEAPIKKQDEMKKEIQEIISEKTLEEWMDIFSEVDACVSPVLSLEEMIENPQVKAREMIQSITDNKLTMKYIGIPIKLSKTPGKIHSLAPRLGEHTKDILGRIRI